MRNPLITLLLLISAGLLAQSPQKFSYQAVIRDGSNKLIANDTVGVKISILHNTVSGAVVYAETHRPISNINGLVTFKIGTGNVLSGNFGAINWANGPYFIETATDPSGGSDYTLTATNQLISVPYAMFANAADSAKHATIADSIRGFTPGSGGGSPGNETDPVFGSSVAAGITGNDTAYWNAKQREVIAGSGVRWVGDTLISTVSGASRDFYLGQDTLGGIVFHLYWGADGEQHGLILSKTEATRWWQNGAANTGATSTWDGASNTASIGLSQALIWISGLGPEWYLPAIDELRYIRTNRYHINKALEAGGHTLLSNDHYFSSTEKDMDEVYGLNWWGISILMKASGNKVRGVRSF